MRVTKIDFTAVKTYTVHIEGGEVREQPYSGSRRTYRVQVLEVFKRNGNFGRVTLRGAVIKKDGSLGAVSAREELYRSSEWPEWVSDIIKGLA